MPCRDEPLQETMPENRLKSRAFSFEFSKSHFCHTKPNHIMLFLFIISIFLFANFIDDCNNNHKADCIYESFN